MSTQKINQKGFTLIELLLVILVIGILAVIGITQFTNFGRDAREAAVKANLQVLRLGIAAQNGMMRNRCAYEGSAWPLLSSLRANNITTFTTYNNYNSTVVTAAFCTVGQVTTDQDRKFVSIGLPTNPWSPPKHSATAASIGDGVNLTLGAECSGGTGTNSRGSAQTAASGAYGWCYNEYTGEIWANSRCNDGATPCDTTGSENTY